MLVTLFQYKAWANTELHDALAQFDAQQHPTVFRDMLQILDHANVVDRIFQGHLSGAAASPFKTTHSALVPSLLELREQVSATDDWYIQCAFSISAEQLKQRVHFTFTDGERGAMSREEMLLHVITHSGYHRGSVGQMLETLGINSPPDSLTKFLHKQEPQRRLGATN